MVVKGRVVAILGTGTATGREYEGGLGVLEWLLHGCVCFVKFTRLHTSELYTFYSYVHTNVTKKPTCQIFK